MVVGYLQPAMEADGELAAMALFFAGVVVGVASSDVFFFFLSRVATVSFSLEYVRSSNYYSAVPDTCFPVRIQPRDRQGFVSSLRNDC